MPDGGFLEKVAPRAAEVYKNPLTIPLADAMDWTLVLDQALAVSRSKNSVNPQKYFVVAFRSVRSKNADTEKLYAADALALAEAKKSGGLLRYWYADMNERRECMAICVWESREQALIAIHLPAHRAAMEVGRVSFDTIILERYWLIPGTDGIPILEKLPTTRQTCPSMQ